MPVIRVSNEAYQKLLGLQSKDGNSMSVFMDRLVARYGELEDESKRTESRDKGRSPKRAGATKKRDTKAKQSGGKLVEGMEDLYED